MNFNKWWRNKSLPLYYSSGKEVAELTWNAVLEETMRIVRNAQVREDALEEMEEMKS